MRSALIPLLIVVSLGALSACSSKDQNTDRTASTIEATDRGDESPSSDRDSTPEQTAVADATEPTPEELVRKLADYLCDLPAFACHVDLVIHVQANGMDNRMTNKMNVSLERPNRLAVIAAEGVMGTTVVSDGQQLFQHLPMLNRYSVEEAPADFAQFVNVAGLQMIGLPAGAIPTNGAEFYQNIMKDVIGSEYLGTEKIGDVVCHHCRFAQADVDWDIWIAAGDRPLVYKIVPDLTKQLEAVPAEMGDAGDVKIEYVFALSDWNVAPQFTDADFAFTPPADAELVDSLLAGLGGGMEEGPHPLLGEAAPTFQTVDLDGQPIDLTAVLNNNVVMLDFWATWCGPCIEAMPEVLAVANKYKDRGVVFYAVNVMEDGPTVNAFLTAQVLDVPVAFDADGTVSELYGVTGIPQTVLIGKDGRVQVVHVGFGPNLSEVLSGEIEALLDGKDLAAEKLAAKSDLEQTRTTDAAEPTDDGE